MRATRALAGLSLKCRQLRDRKTDDEARITGTRFHGDLAVVRIDNDPAYDVETESSAFAHLFGGEERIEDPRNQVARDARALIRDLDNHRVVVVACPDEDLPASVQGIDGVINEIRPDLI